MSRVWLIQGPGGCDPLGSSSEEQRGSGKLAGLLGPSKDKRMSRMRSRELTVEVLVWEGSVPEVEAGTDYKRGIQKHWRAGRKWYWESQSSAGGGMSRGHQAVM